MHVVVASNPQARFGRSGLVGDRVVQVLRAAGHAGVHRTDAASFDPVGPVRILRRPLPPVLADRLVDASLLTGALFTAGVAHRVIGPLHSALQTWNFSYRNS